MTDEQKSPTTSIIEGSSVTASRLITITDPEELKKYGWTPPLPSYVTAAPKLWELWLRQTTLEK